MDAAPSPAPPQPPSGSSAWPRAAQLAAALLLGGAIALLGAHAWGYQRWGNRPTDLDHTPAYRIDLNHADRAELLQLPGVGPNLAERIETYRREHNGFRNVEELRHVHGIGPLMMGRLRPWVCVGDADDDPETETTTVSVKPPSSPTKRTQVSVSGKKGVLTEPLDLNTAMAEELRKHLPDIGPKKAQAIVDEREKGAFKSVDDLRRVHGIGQKTVDKLRPFLKVGGESERVVVRE